jgi:hypothetical protein
VTRHWVTRQTLLLQEGLLSAFLPLMLILVNNGVTQVVDDRAKVDAKRAVSAFLLQAYWLAMFFPMPLANFLDSAQTVTKNFPFF